jgi:Holliday junction resolvasome RuvABC endonuclease subunit
MKILAIDQSYTSCGIVVLNDGQIQYVERFVTDKTRDIFERAWELTEHLRAIALNCKPDVIALEGLAFAKNGNATRDLASLQSAIVTVLRFIDKYDTMIISPNTVKKVATGKGNSSKEEMVEMLPEDVRREFDALGVKKTTGLHDLCDAYFIGIAAQNVLITQEKI